MIKRHEIVDLIIDAKRTDPETGSFTEWLDDYLIGHLPALGQANNPLTLEQAKKEKFIWFEPLKEWGKVTPDGVLFFGTEEWSTWEILSEEWGYRFQVYRYPLEGEETKQNEV